MTEPEGDFVIRNSSMRFVLSFLVGTVSLAAAQSSQRISLDDAVILVDGGEPSYVQYAAKDLASYLTEITGKTAAGKQLGECKPEGKSGHRGRGKDGNSDGR